MSIHIIKKYLNGTILLSWIIFNFLFVFLIPINCTADAIFKLNDYTLKGSSSYLNGNPSRAGESLINIVVEIPAGTNQKWEVTKPDGLMVWKLNKGKRRVVQYLPYPVNYGMVPQTILSKSMGGDGDPLDVLLLGPALPRGTIAIGRIVGVLKFLDDGEQDDKLIAVSKHGPFEKIKTMKELNQEFPGTITILKTWFINYKGTGRMKFQGFDEIQEAERILDQAIQSYLKF